jgi:XRE family aerobic/anaerobic benzoate catabolism transcriptional regulator
VTDPFLIALGERIRALRGRQGHSRRSLAAAAGLSERHLANLELGTGNASVLVLQQVAAALRCALADLVDPAAPASSHWVAIRALLANRSEADLEAARMRLEALFADRTRATERSLRIALIGLRGAGKSTLGQRLAHSLRLPFVELSRQIESVAGMAIDQIHALYGAAAYRRYERRALELTLQQFPAAVIATPGGIVSEETTFEILLSHCFTVWLRAQPEDHMSRVIAQGDLRPMAGNDEAMGDLRRILEGRTPSYARADVAVDTSGQSVEAATAELLRAVVGPGAGDTSPDA